MVALKSYPSFLSVLNESCAYNDTVYDFPRIANIALQPHDA